MHDQSQKYILIKQVEFEKGKCNLTLLTTIISGR